MHEIGFWDLNVSAKIALAVFRMSDLWCYTENVSSRNLQAGMISELIS
jgi:hypothetical protein